MSKKIKSYLVIKKKNKKKNYHTHSLGNQKKERKKGDDKERKKRKKEKRKRQCAQESTKKKERGIGQIAYVQVHMGIFVHQATLFSHFSFLSILEGKLFSGSREKTPRSHYLFSFYPTQLNTLQKSFHSHFLSKVFHPSYFTSKQTHPKSIYTFKKLYFKHQNACFIQTWVLKSIYNKLSKPQIWRVNP